MSQETQYRRRWTSQALLVVGLITVFSMTTVGAVRIWTRTEHGDRVQSAGRTPSPTLTPPQDQSPYPIASFDQIKGWIALRIGAELVALDPKSPDRIVALPHAAPGAPLGWSPDGSQLIVERGDQVVVIGADERSRTFPPDTGRMSFSPDGSRVVFDREGELFVTAAIGGLRRRIVSTAKPDPCVQPSDCDGSRDPEWSPDGSVIGFIDKTIVERAGTPLGHVSRTTISLVRPNGTGRRVLISLGRSDRAAAAHSTSDLVWSPDGSQLAFVSSGGIYVVDADGSDLRRLTVRGESPTWSPDGKRVALLVDRQLRIIDVARGRPHVIVARLPRGALHSMLAWNPAS